LLGNHGRWTISHHDMDIEACFYQHIDVEDKSKMTSSQLKSMLTCPCNIDGRLLVRPTMEGPGQDRVARGDGKQPMFGVASVGRKKSEGLVWALRRLDPAALHKLQTSQRRGACLESSLHTVVRSGC
jgi:hypothetical protein